MKMQPSRSRVNLFREQTPEDERRHNRISGGQVTAQALTAADKPAVLSNGVRTAAPPDFTPGARIVALTEDGSYLERAKD